jgi:hypothetical protein
MGEVEDRGAAFLEHFGVKGMKWGVRKEKIKAGLKKWGSELATQYEDSMWEQHAYSTRAYVERHNAAADHFNQHIDRLNNAPKYRDKNLNERRNAKLKYDYDRDVENLMHRSNEHAAKQVHGQNASKTKEVVYDRKTQTFKVKDVGGKQGHTEKMPEPDPFALDHADTGVDFNPTFKVRVGPDGKIIQVNRAKLEGMQQADEFVDDFLEHYGVKGMKWGVRKSEVPTGETKVTQKGKKLKGEGGKGLSPHPDATKAAISKQKAKGSGLQSLSNKELKDLQTRLNLEKNVRELSVADKQAQTNPAARFIKRTLFNSGKQEAQKAANNAASKTVAAMMKKG